MQMNVTTLCFEDLTTAEYRGDEGYKTSWYDVDNDPIDGRTQNFTFEIPKVDGDVYVSVESYFFKMVNPKCTNNTHKPFPITDFKFSKNGILIRKYISYLNIRPNYVIFTEDPETAHEKWP